jgi:hypothetical protein
MKHDIEEHPELFNFYTSVVDGSHLKHWQFYNERQDLMASLNGRQAQQRWAQTGKYY